MDGPEVAGQPAKGREHNLSATVDILNPNKPKRVAIIASNPAISKQTGWPIAFWWSELTHPYWDFAAHGYLVDVYSPDGGALQADTWSDPRDESKYSAHDLISLGFICSKEHSKLVESSLSIDELKPSPKQPPYFCVESLTLAFEAIRGLTLH